MAALAVAISTGAFGFVISVVQRLTRVETRMDGTGDRIDFIYDRMRMNIAAAAHDPDPESAPKDRLIEKFVQKRIALSEVRKLAEILEEERQAEDAKKALRAENLLELIRYEFQLG